MSKFEYVGTLPQGDWKFCLVVIKGRPDVIVMCDSTGVNAPRMFINGKMVVIKPQ